MSRIYLLFTFFLVSFYMPLGAWGQRTKINIENADRLIGIGPQGNKTNKLIGNVVFKQDNIFMYCDSAFLYEEQNSIDAFGHVHIVQGDSTHLYGDLLKYDGNTKQAELFDNITLQDRTLTLTTTRLHYDLLKDVASYFYSAYIVDKQNTLTSLRGFYYSKTRDFFFKDSVVLRNPSYEMAGDTLKYNTLNKTAYFYGPTNITSKENKIYCEYGFYNTAKETSQLKRNTVLYSDKRELRADSLLYNRKTGIGLAYQHVSLLDTAQKLLITGNKGYYNRFTSLSLVTEQALMSKYFDKDTLFLHADTLASTYDSCSTERMLYAYKNVRVYKPDLSAYCDSMTYSSLDSIMHLRVSPIVWSNENQLTAETIDIQISNKKMDKMYLNGHSFVISKVDSTEKYNQIKGKKMTGFFADGHLYKIKVEGNGQTVYYGKDDKKLVGVNKAACSDLLIYLEKNKVNRVTLLNKPDGTFYPIGELAAEELLLKDFNWQYNKRPKNKHDLFLQ